MPDNFNLIKFKRGTMSGLKALTSAQIEDGTFYLTIDNNTDTSRLFIGKDGKTLPVNHSIITVANKSALDSATSYQEGDFAYITDGNILAVRHHDVWVQINAPDSRAIKDFSTAVNTSNGTATISFSLRDQNDNVIPAATGELQPFSIAGAAGTGITVSNSGNNITIAGDPATLAASAPNANSTTVSLTSTGGSSSGSFTLSSGDSNVTIGGTANAITISAKDTVLDSVHSESGNGDGSSGTDGFYFTVADTDDHAVTGTIDPIIVLADHTATSDQIHFSDGTATLPVYSKNDIDGMLKGLNAMTYKGLVGSTGNRYETLGDITNPSIGDTFLATADIANVPVRTGATNSTAHAGDLLIANTTGTENANGQITSGLYYDIVPSGNDDPLVYSMERLGDSNNGNGFKLIEGDGVIGSMEISAGSQMAVSTTSSGTNGANVVVEVAHGTISSATNGNPSTGTAVPQTPGNTLTINAVTGLTTNNGHVTAVQVTPYQVKDSVSVIDDELSEVEVQASNNVATVTNKVALVNSMSDAAIGSKDLAFDLASQNLTVTAPAIQSGNPRVMVNFV